MAPSNQKRDASWERDEDFPLDKSWVEPKRIAFSKKGAVATAHFRATEAGLRMFHEGGNVMDAAVAAAFALCVCEPAASGLGGQTMMLIYDAKTRKKIALDGSSKAPHRTEPGLFQKKDILRGLKATTVPSTPAVLQFVLKKYGTKSLEEVLRPAVELAGEGFLVSPLHHSLLKRNHKYLKKGSAGRFFLKEGKFLFPVGALFKQPVLARTLKRIAKEGVEDFYLGKIASEIHRDMEKNGGLIHKDDLAQIPWPVMRRPITCRFGTARVFTLPPPGAGRTLIQVLNILNHFSEKRRDPDTPNGILLLAEAIRKANLDRKDRPYDPNLYPHDIQERMLRPKRAKKIARRMEDRFDLSGETTHLSVMDAEGNAVALTQSIERVFGSCEANPELGFLYNNYMSAFEYEDISHPYYLRPTASPWASVAPAIAFKGTKPWLVWGSPGSERIISAMAQVLMRLGHQSPFDAVEAPRLHCSVKSKVSLEAPRIPDAAIDLLKSHSFEIDEREAYSFYLGCVQLVLREKNGRLVAVADPRRDGSAAGIKT